MLISISRTSSKHCVASLSSSNALVSFLFTEVLDYLNVMDYRVWTIEYKHWRTARTNPFQLGAAQYLLCFLCHSGKHTKMPSKIQSTSYTLKGNYSRENAMKEKKMQKSLFFETQKRWNSFNLPLGSHYVPGNHWNFGPNGWTRVLINSCNQ